MANHYHYYALGNTAKGRVNYLPSSLQEIKQVFLLQGAPRAVVTQALQYVIQCKENQSEQELLILHSAADEDALDAVLAPTHGIAYVNEEAWQDSFTHDLPELDVVTVSLASAVTATEGDASITLPEVATIAEQPQIVEAHAAALAYFQEALRIHDVWEAIYIKEMNFDKADELTRAYISRLIGSPELADGSKEGRELHRYLGAATPVGPRDFVPQLTEGLKRYFIKGRAGSGKSTLLKKIAAAARTAGHEVEIYHCGFDPASLDMVIVRELGFAIFDSTSPHEYDPELETDEILDMYAACITPGTDEANAAQIADIQQQYAGQIKLAIEQLALAKSAYNSAQAAWSASVDSESLVRILQPIV